MIEASYQILVKEPRSFYNYPQKYLIFLLGIGYIQLRVNPETGGEADEKAQAEFRSLPGFE